MLKFNSLIEDQYKITLNGYNWSFYSQLLRTVFCGVVFFFFQKALKIFFSFQSIYFNSGLRRAVLNRDISKDVAFALLPYWWKLLSQIW